MEFKKDGTLENILEKPASTWNANNYILLNKKSEP